MLRQFIVEGPKKFDVGHVRRVGRSVLHQLPVEQLSVSAVVPVSWKSWEEIK